MQTSSPTVVVNRLLERLPPLQRRQLLAQCTLVQLQFGEVLCEANTDIQHVYFPLTGFISLIARVSNGQQPIEMGMIGHEGMLGATLVLGVNVSPLHALVQGSGSALRISAAAFRQQLQASPAVKQNFDTYLYVLIEQLAQNAACNCFHEVLARLARWLLMTHDRAPENHFHLTHLFLAQMLGVRRSAVSIAANQLRQQKLIRYSRGKITVLSRAGLEAASCGCYAVSIAVYERHLPASASSS